MANAIEIASPRRFPALAVDLNLRCRGKAECLDRACVNGDTLTLRLMDVFCGDMTEKKNPFLAVFDPRERMARSGLNPRPFGLKPS